MMISTYVLIPNYLNFKKSLHEQGIGIKMHFSMEQPVSNQITVVTDHILEYFMWFMLNVN